MIRAWLRRRAARRCLIALLEVCPMPKDDATVAAEDWLWVLAGEPSLGYRLLDEVSSAARR